MTASGASPDPTCRPGQRSASWLPKGRRLPWRSAINEAVELNDTDTAPDSPVKRAKETLYTFGEEVAHGLTHGIGALLSIAGLSILVAKAAVWGQAIDIVAGAIFGTTLVLMYTASTLFHSIPLPATKRVLRVIDHCLIYVLIAGTYTPFNLVTLHGVWGWSLFGFTWGLALVGIVFKIFTTGRFEYLSLGIYLMMGWCGLVAVKPMLHGMEAGGLWLLLAGGLAYTFGTVFYSWHRLPYHHAIWHGFVLAGSVLHYFCVLFYVLPGPAGT